MIETVNEIPSVSDYYDGSNNLNVIKIDCNIYANPEKCLKHSSCGWCNASKRCILGNNLGPQQPCPRSSYIYSAPYPNWDPQARIIQGDINGIGINVLNKFKK